MTMVHKVAIAIATAQLDNPNDPEFDFYALTEEIADQYYAMARAAIEAMMEPTESMLDAGDAADGYDVYVGVWTAMVQAALKEGQK